MQIHSDSVWAPAHNHKDTREVKRSEITTVADARRLKAKTSKRGDSLQTSALARIMSRELGRSAGKALASPERLAKLATRFSGESPAALRDAEIDAVLDGLLQRA